MSYPGTGSFQPPVTAGFPLWLRIQHFVNLLFMLFIIRSGVRILADHPRLQLDAGSMPGREWLRLRGPVPVDRMQQEPPERAWMAKDDAVSLPGWLGLTGLRHTIGLARWWHFSFDLLWLINGVIFYVLLFVTPQWQWLVPRSWDVIPNTVSAALQYLSLNFPANQGWTQSNGLQVLTYFITIFIAAPLRLRNELELGFKQVKWLGETASIHENGSYAPGASSQNGTHLEASAVHCPSKG